MSYLPISAGAPDLEHFSWAHSREMKSPDKRFFQCCFFFLAVFISEHFIVLGNNLPGGKVSDHLLMLNKD